MLIIARILIASVFVGLGLERLLIGTGVMAGGPVGSGAMAFSALELLAGLLIMLGWQVRWIASLLAVFILIDAVLAHAFWAYPASERHGQLLHFLKNLSTLGGLLLLAWLDHKRASRVGARLTRTD
jgi:putative oxidoreductase